MTRPLIPILVGFIGGILLQYTLRTSQSGALTYSLPGLILLYSLLFSLAYLTYRRQYIRLTTLLLAILAIIIGMTRYAASNYVPIDHISHLVKNELVTIEGFLYQPLEYLGQKRYVYIHTTWVEKNSQRYRTTGKIRITLTQASRTLSRPKRLSYGDTIRARLHLSQPENFGDFDYREYLRRRGIYLLGNLYQERNLLRLPHRQGTPILRWIYGLQVHILQFLNTYAQQQQVTGHDSSSEHTQQAIQVIKAMTLGKSRGVDPAVREMFRNAGMYHFLVISGIHIAILTWGFHKVLNLFAIPLRYRSAFLSLALLIYAGVTGFHFPVLRAVIMASTFYFSITCNRISDPFYSLLFSVGLILFLLPNSLFEISFQMTVAATASILLFFRFFQRQHWLERINRFPWLLRLPIMTVLATTGAMIGVSPLTLYYFGQFYPISFISNPLALPFVSLLLPASLVVNFSSLLFDSWNLLRPLLSVNVFLARCLLSLSAIFPVFEVKFPPPSLLVIIIYYASMYCLLNVSWDRMRALRKD